METSSLDDLAARVAAAGRHPQPLCATLMALAALDPPGALAWVAAHPEETRGIPPDKLSSVLVALARACVERPGGFARDDMLAVLARYGDVLPSHDAFELAGAACRSATPDPDLDVALRTVLARAPGHAGLLRAAADQAVAAGDTARAHELLTRLGRADPTLATAQLVHRHRATLPPLDHTPVRIAVLSSFTIDPLIPYIDLECRTLGLEPHMYVAPFNSWEREVFGGDAGVAEFAPDITFLAAAADDLIAGLGEGVSSATLRDEGEIAVGRLLSAAERLLSWSPGHLVVHGLYTVHPDPVGAAAWSDDEPSRNRVFADLNAKLADGLRALSRAHFLDMTDLLMRRRRGPLDNPKMRHMARMRVDGHTLGDLARAYARIIAPATGRTRKCVVVDLDNTLWGGIVGEDGVHGIRLGNTSPGSEYREFQQYLLTLTRRGILLAINSKNNADDALEVIRTHDAMVLREEAFSAMRINWEHKPSNMVSLAEELGIGVDSLVFVDDSEKERALMRQALPQVLTPELPRDPSRYRAALEELPELQTLFVTTEDRVRTRQYAERRQREQLRVSSETLDDYFASLGIIATIDLGSERTLARIHQLFQRTNQFNLTGRRYELGDLTDRASDAAWRVYTTHVSDRFGEHGLVATALVHIAGSAWAVENFVMSCRVISYGVEDALLAQIGADAKRAGARRLIGEFRASPKNAPARGFYERNGFGREADGDVERWSRDVSGPAMAPPKWITVQVAHDA